MIEFAESLPVRDVTSIDNNKVKCRTMVTVFANELDIFLVIAVTFLATALTTMTRDCDG